MKTVTLDIKLLESEKDLDRMKRGDVISLHTKYDGKTYYKNVGLEGSYSHIPNYYSGLAIYAGKGKVWSPANLEEKSKEVLKFIGLKILPRYTDIYQVAKDEMRIEEGTIIGSSFFLMEKILFDLPFQDPQHEYQDPQQQYINLLREVLNKTR